LQPSQPFHFGRANIRLKLFTNINFVNDFPNSMIFLGLAGCTGVEFWVTRLCRNEQYCAATQSEPTVAASLWNNLT